MPTPNPSPWASIDNTGVVYSNLCGLRRTRLEAVATLIQRWWRHEALFPIRYKAHLVTVFGFKRFCAACAITDKYVYAYEKLDGTNLGVRCDGTIFGRRCEVSGSTYQKTSLSGTPSGMVVRMVRDAVATEIGMDPGPTVLYGELMCNPKKYAYTEMPSWMYFGLVVSPPNPDEVGAALRRAGFFAYTCMRDVQVSLNPRLTALVEGVEALRSAPLMAEGALRTVCLELQDTMMRATLEGVVLSGDGLLQKWKTGVEDESSSAMKLRGIIDAPWVDTELVKCLHDVASNRGVYAPDAMAAALKSAMSKYDVVDPGTADGRKLVKCLIREVQADLGGCGDKRLTAHIRCYVAKALAPK